MPADQKYPGLNRDNWTTPIQMQLSKTQKYFSAFFATFLKSKLNLKYFQTKYDPHRVCISEIMDS